MAEEPESELITRVEVRPANEYDADAVTDLIGRQRQSVGLVPEELLCKTEPTARPMSAPGWPRWG